MIRRSKHNLSHYHLLTADMGQLIPIGMMEALPGDTVQHHANVLVRVSPLAAPVMHPVSVRIHHFFVPNRITWTGAGGDNWEDFITGGDDGMNAASPPTIPSVDTPGTLLDYLGIPLVAGVPVSLLPIRAFNKIFNEYYRDQDLVPERDQDDITIPRIAWEKDYFSSARPWTQKGPEVTLPLGDRAPVSGIGVASTPHALYAVRETGGVDKTYATGYDSTDTNATIAVEGEPGNTNYPNIYANLADAIGGNINDIRRAFAIQRYQEARARYGSRYTEYLRYLGVSPSDGRLQRPEFLGGGRTQINFSEVLQTAPETGEGPTTEYGVGDLYGHGIAAMRSNKYRRFIEEHGYIISCLSVRPKVMYTNGIHRTWLRHDKEDYFQKELQHIGQQEILNDEIFAEPGNDRTVFGYADRYRDYREVPSHVSAEFRQLLNYWHMGREFEELPVLNQSFVDCVPTKRIHNEQTQHALWIMAQHKMVARRLVSRNASARIF